VLDVGAPARAQAHLPVAACLVAAALIPALVWCFGALLPPAFALAFVAIFLWCVAPGILAARVIYRGWLPALMIGPVWGFTASSLALLVLWTAGIRQPAALACAPVLAATATLAAGRLRGALQAPAFSRRDLAPLLLVLCLVPLVDGVPYARVGEPTPAGKAYRAYFTADLTWAMAEISAVSKGAVPPEDPFLPNRPLHYYWLANLLSSVEHRVTLNQVTSDKVLLCNGLLLGLSFLAAFYFFVRHFAASPGWSAAAVVFAVLCGSFEGAYAYRVSGGSLEYLRGLNIDAVTRWLLMGMPVDGLQRVLWYQPHHATAWALCMSAALMVVAAKDNGALRVNVAAGLLLAACLLLSPFPAIMAGVALALYQAITLGAERRWRAMIVGGVGAALPAVLAVIVTRALAYVDDAASGLVVFGVNQVARKNAAMVVFLSFGPVLVTGVAGAIVARIQRARALLMPLLLSVVAFVCYFLVDIPEHQSVYVAFRAGHLLFLSLAALTAFAWQEAWRASRPLALAVTAGSALLALCALPTTVIDWYNTQDITNLNDAPFGKWTLVVSPDELAAIKWVRGFTPADAVVQIEPVVHGRQSWFFVPAFADRRMIAGLPTSMIPLKPYEDASARVERLFKESDPGRAYDEARALGIEYLFVGPVEQAAYPGLAPALDTIPLKFRPVYRNGSVVIYQVT
jgi:hypothetical protein